VLLAVASLSEVAELGMGRPLADGSLRIGAGPTDSRTTPAASARGGITLQATYACVRGLGLTRLGLLRGILDAPLNQALDVDPTVGFQPTWATELANVIGSTGIEIVIEELQADVAQLDAADLTISDAGAAPAPSVGRQPRDDGVLGRFREHLPDRHQHRRPHVAQ